MLKDSASPETLGDHGLDLQHFAGEILGNLPRAIGFTDHVLEVGEIVFRSGRTGVNGGGAPPGAWDADATT